MKTKKTQTKACAFEVNILVSSIPAGSIAAICTLVISMYQLLQAPAFAYVYLESRICWRVRASLSFSHLMRLISWIERQNRGHDDFSTGNHFYFTLAACEHIGILVVESLSHMSYMSYTCHMSYIMSYTCTSEYMTEVSYCITLNFRCNLNFGKFGAAGRHLIYSYT